MKKREELGLKYKHMYWLMGRRSAMSTHNKLVLYKQIPKPVWTYGLQLCGCTKPSNTAIIQRFQNKVLRNIIDAPWYVRNADIHRDLNMELVTAEISPYPTAFPYGNGMVLHFYQQQESSTTKTVYKVINKGLKTYV